MKNNIKLVYIPLLLISLVGCGGGNKKSTFVEPVYGDKEYYKKINDRVGYDKESTLSFVESFETPMSDAVWTTINGSWHTDVPDAPHNGVQRRNLFYTKDSSNNGYLAIKGRGYYSMEEDSISGLPEGGCIVSKEHLTPGRYEIKMAAHPREGAVSAMWSYCTTTGDEKTSQNEIDIELGGTTDGTQFEHEWCTSWTKKLTKQTNAINTTEHLFLNDGRIHTYTYDWYTNFPATNDTRVDWFIDGMYITSLLGDVVPTHAMPLWVGVWFPPLWSGQSEFEEDYMLVDEITFKAFDPASQYVEKCRSYISYNNMAPSQSNIQNIEYEKVTSSLNKIANGSFEKEGKSSRNKDSYYGWFIDAPDSYNGTMEFVNDASKGNKAIKLSANETDKDKEKGMFLGQTISNSYEGYKFAYSVDAKKLTASSVGNLEIDLLNRTHNILKRINVPVESLTYQTLKGTIEMEKDCAALQIFLTCEDGEIIYDNIILNRVL